MKVFWQIVTWIFFALAVMALLLNFAVTVIVACGFYAWDKARGKR